MFHQTEIGIIIGKVDGRRLQNAARLSDFVAQRQVRFEAARKARDVINDDNVRLLA